MLNVIQKRLKNHIIGEGTFLIEKGKANIRVLENDVKESFNKHNDQDFNDRVYN